MKALFTILLLALLAAPGQAAETNDITRAEVRTALPAPDFTLPDLDGKPVKLTDYADKPVIVLFWASWDKYCKRQLPVLVDLQKRYGPQGLTVLAISLDSPNSAELKNFANQQNLNFPILHFDLKVIQAYGGITAVPTLFILDKNHNIIEKFVGFTEAKPIETNLTAIFKN